MRRAKIEEVKSQIFGYFEAGNIRVFTLSQLDGILASQRQAWNLPKSTTLPGFIDFLTKQEKLRKYRLDFLYRPITLCLWGSPSSYEIAMAITPRAYLSHYSAMHYHQLAPAHEHRVVYVNDEQEAKPSKSSGLTQERIDAAFKRKARETNNFAEVEDTFFCLLSGKHTAMLDVLQQEVPDIPVPVRVTSIERTLIDIAVRPIYAGGPVTILEAYRRAAPHVDVERMSTILEQLDYVYPYHQAIGFYLDRAGRYAPEVIETFRRMPQQFDFYLDYQMKDTSYSLGWRIYYPSTLSSL